MKNSLSIKSTTSRFILITLMSFTFISLSNAQDNSKTFQSEPFIEANVGFVNFHPGVFPGASVLIGNTMVSKNNFIIDYEIGLAFPTIGTAKLGVGKRMDEFDLTIGIRPFPSTIYLQGVYHINENSSFLFSGEAWGNKPLFDIGLEKMSIINVGYRYNLKSRKNNKQQEINRRL